MKRVIALFFGLMAAAALAGSPIDERRDADPDGEVEISNVAGSVTVTGWNEGRIEITGELGAGSERLDVVQEGDRTLIKVVLPENERRVESTDLRVKVPRDSSLAVTVVSADVRVSGVRGAQRLQTVSGDVSTDPWQDCEVKTVSGDVQVAAQGEGGNLTLTAVSGDMTIEAVGGELAATTVSGDLDVRAKDVTRARVVTTNGDIDMSADMPADSRVDAETINGDVDLEINGDTDVDVDVETFNGDIDNCFGSKAVEKSRYGPGQELRFETGTGTRRIRIKTLNGDVDICGR